jgi:hypothetical protein
MKKPWNIRKIVSVQGHHEYHPKGAFPKKFKRLQHLFENTLPSNGVVCLLRPFKRDLQSGEFSESCQGLHHPLREKEAIRDAHQFQNGRVLVKELKESKKLLPKEKGLSPGDVEDGGPPKLCEPSKESLCHSKEYIPPVPEGVLVAVATPKVAAIGDVPLEIERGFFAFQKMSPLKR